jgi:hypothetical protein
MRARDTLEAWRPCPYRATSRKRSRKPAFGRARAARRARGILAGTAGKHVSEELIADRRAEARADSADPAA